MTTPARYGRYPLLLSALMSALAVLGFAVSVSDSKSLSVVFGAVYLLVFLAWWLVARKLRRRL